jgi:hypothetical protein
MKRKGQGLQQDSQWWMTYTAPQQRCGVEHLALAGTATAEAYRLLRRRLRMIGHGKEGEDAR